MRKSLIGLFVVAAAALVFGTAFGAELEHNGKSFGWQDREYFGCKGEVCTIQIGGGDAAAGESGDAGAAAGASTGGDSGGNSGDSCGDK